MLVEEPRVMMESLDPMTALVAAVGGRIAGAKQIETGIYEIGHFGSSHFLRGRYYDWMDKDKPDLSDIEYGVCDNHEQILEHYPELSDPKRRFVVTLTRIVAADEPEDGGWRWHKWGPYIGTREPTTEYIRDEPEIDQVFCYHIYEQKPDARD